MNKLLEMWYRVLHLHEADDHEDQPLPEDLARDPDLDIMHREQHDLMNQKAREVLRDSWNERVKRGWGVDRA